MSAHRQPHLQFFAAAILTVLALSPAVSAAESWATPVKTHPVRELDGPHAISDGTLETTADLQRFFVSHRGDLETILAMAGWPGDPATLFAAVREGAVEVIDFPVDGRLMWMAIKRNGKTLEVLKNPQWKGPEAFSGFLVRLESEDSRWAFVIPKACGNLSLFSKMGTAELTLTLESGVAQLFDPEGRPITIHAGETGTVSAEWADRFADQEIGKALVPTSVGVSEGTVEFKEYGRPISVMVAGGNAVSATLNPDGTMALAVPEGNASPMPIKVGDAVGTLSAGAGMAVDWTAPTCAIALRPQGECLPAEVVVDAGASSVSGGQVTGVELSVVLPNGEREDMGAGDFPGRFLWTRRFEEPGAYRFEAVAVSDKGRRSTNACSAEMELPRCIPPLPTCKLEISSPVVSTFETLKINGAKSSSDGGEIDAVMVRVRTGSGRHRGIVTMKAPFEGELELERAGTYKLTAVAVDDYGQGSENTCELDFVVKSPTSFSGWGFAGYGSRMIDNAPAAQDGFLVGFAGSVDRYVGRSLEVSLAAGLGYQDVPDNELKLFTDMQLFWIKTSGFIGGGVGYWDITNNETSGLNLLFTGGFDLPWHVKRKPVQLYGQGRLFLDELGGVGDNFVVLAGLRFAFN